MALLPGSRPFCSALGKGRGWPHPAVSKGMPSLAPANLLELSSWISRTCPSNSHMCLYITHMDVHAHGHRRHAPRAQAHTHTTVPAQLLHAPGNPGGFSKEAEAFNTANACTLSRRQSSFNKTEHSTFLLLVSKYTYDT